MGRMKVKNIAFSGFAAAILATGMANADVPKIASQAYVDRVDAKVTELNTDLTTNYTTTEGLGGVISEALKSNNSTISQALEANISKALKDGSAEISAAMDENIKKALESNDSAIAGALEAKEDTSNKVNAINAAAISNADAYPTAGAVASYIDDKVTNGLEVNADKIAEGAVTTDKIAAGAVTTAKIDNGAVTADKLADDSVTTDKIVDRSVTADKLSEALNEKIDAAQTSADVSTAIAAAVTADGALKDALDAKVTAAQVTTAIETYTIPVPPAICTAVSKRCLLSVGPDNKLTWIDVTDPAD